MGLENKVAIVTGAAQGIGLAIAERLARDGATVAIVDLHANKAEEAAGKLSSSGYTAVTEVIDIADSASVAEGVNNITKKLGPVTVLINNAGVYKSTPLLEASEEFWKLCLDVMLTGTMLMTRAIAPSMMEANWGRVVNLGSFMSNVAFGEDAAYCTAKSGILGLTRSLAAELAKYNICVNTVCPGNILTDMLRQTATAIESRDGLASGSWLQERGRQIPLGRLGEPEDIARAVGFFCGEDADYITGQALHVNGGLYYH